MTEPTLPVSQPAEELAKRFHETYERLAPSFGYKTRKESARPWAEVPADNRALMTAVCQEILAERDRELQQAKFSQNVWKNLAADWEVIARTKEGELQQARNWRTMCIVEVAAENSSVSDYVKHWEGRAESADVCCHMDWSGGFVMELSNGRFAYLSGWCDYTGWGCQDGAEIVHAAALTDLQTPSEETWDENPADLNKWLKEGSKPWEDRP